jgi:hypothetical protein
MTSGAEMRVRLGDRLGVAAATYVLFAVKPGPALVLSVVLVFAIWIGCRCLCRRFALIKAPPPGHPWLTLGREPPVLSVPAA